MNMQPSAIARGAQGRGQTGQIFAQALTLNLAELGYIAFLLLVFVGVTPFADGDATTWQTAVLNGGGDLARQVAYLLDFALIAIAVVRRGGRRALQAFPPLYVLLLCWCLMSALWSPDPGITLRRGTLLCMVSASVMLSVHSIGPSRALQLLCYVVAAVVAIDLLSVVLVPQARHLASGIEPQLAGDWRGVHGHKNVAGALYSNIALVALFLAWATRSRWAVVLAFASCIFLVGTNSKSSLGIFPFALLAGTIYYLASRNTLNRKRVLVGLALGVTIMLAGLCIWWDPLTLSLRDPALFTGRAAIWQAEWAYISDHFLLGSGFGSFSYTGKTSPLHNYIGSAWTGSVANGHQGYLELLVAVGVPGFVLMLVSLFFEPLVLFGRRSRLSPSCRALLFSLFFFFFVHNFMESNFLNTDDSEWVIFLLAITLLRASSIERDQAIVRAER
jgi:O-antigen ligase